MTDGEQISRVVGRSGPVVVGGLAAAASAVLDPAEVADVLSAGVVEIDEARVAEILTRAERG